MDELDYRLNDDGSYTFSSGIISGVKHNIDRLKNYSFINDIVKGIKSKYVEVNKFTCSDRVCFNTNPENHGMVVDKTAPYMAYAIFGKRELFVDEYGCWHMTGFPKGVYKKKLDHKTIAIMSVVYEFYAPHGNSRQIETDGYTAYYIYIIGANANYWNKKLLKRSVAISLKLDVLERNINSGTIIVSGCYFGSVPAKNLDDIIVNESKIKMITSAIDRFLANKDSYSKYNIPYRLGILLYGKPGTGKSALIRALARKYHKKLIYFTRSNINEIADYSAYDIMNAFLVIEEVDTLLEQRKNADDNLGKEMITSYIDALDNGAIVFATTNYRDKIMEVESSIIRPGRFSIHVELEYFNRESAEKMVDKFGIEDKSFLDTLDYPIRPSELEFICSQIRFEQVEKGGI